jgi:hypothetical protein
MSIFTLNAVHRYRIQSIEIQGAAECQNACSRPR